ncbi:MAG: 6,7-dimethyl-8-ribityllumazine synthase [Cyclobacteriaceae bacterium]|nr:MAG: 6,7-dimethyl-8-ribityllumazine synthase [Cyclobacteriaceae bacterium]
MPGVLPSGKVKVNPSVKKKKFAIVVSQWNEEITEALFAGAFSALRSQGIDSRQIIRKSVPGSFELTLGALKMAQKKDIDAVICLGCVIKGETPHFDYICQAVAYGLTEVSLKTGKPVIFGVLTTLTRQQAYERAGGKYGNKGEEAARTALNMLHF